MSRETRLERLGLSHLTGEALEAEIERRGRLAEERNARAAAASEARELAREAERMGRPPQSANM